MVIECYVSPYCYSAMFLQYMQSISCHWYVTVIVINLPAICKWKIQVCVCGDQDFIIGKITLKFRTKGLNKTQDVFSNVLS